VRKLWTVRRVTVRDYGGPEQLTVETVAESPLVGPGQLLVDMEASTT
jgi:NADPH:quinone reductase-like Zn-dependent oxidoreductase